MDEERYKNTDWDSAESMDTILLREIITKTLGDDPQWQELQETAVGLLFAVRLNSLNDN